MSVCCRHCRAELRTEQGLKSHLSRMHGIQGAYALLLERRQQAPRIPCPHCARDFQKGKGLSHHLAQAHGIVSDHPKTEANRNSRPLAPERERVIRGTEPLPRLPDGPVALLETVIRLAKYDGRHGDRKALAWLTYVRGSIRPQASA